MKIAIIGIVIMFAVLGVLYVATRDRDTVSEEPPAAETPVSSAFKL